MEPNEIKKPKVCFTTEVITPAFPEGNAVVFRPLGAHDDFGFKSIFEVHYILDSKPVHQGTLKLGFLNPKQNTAHDIVKEALSNPNGEFYVTSKELPQFFTLQPKIQNYRTLVKQLGIQNARTFLLAINDVVAVSKFFPSTAWLTKATSSKAFTNSMIRQSEAFYSYLNAGPILDGLEYERVGNISDAFNIEFTIDAFNDSIRVPIRYNFKSILPSRITALIGENGVGKSQALRNLVESLMEGDSRVTGINTTQPSFNRVIAIATAGETEKTFPKAKKKSKINYKVIPGRRSSKSDGFNGLSGLILQLIRSPESIGKVDRLHLFLDAIKPIIPLKKIGISIFKESKDEDSTFSKDNFDDSTPRETEVVSIDSFFQVNESRILDLASRVDVTKDPLYIGESTTLTFSSGQISFLRLAAQLCLCIENGSLVLLDEPETHLHPKLITDLVSLLSKLLEFSGSACVLATHSAYFIREIPREQVLVFTRNEFNKIEVKRPRLRTLGADIGEISFHVFGEQDFGHVIERVKTYMIKTEFKEMEILLKALPSEALMYLENELGLKIDYKNE